ncbi:hypothetical protein BYT27DRAFT_7210595 [Phlegmacium glaucopus]|nr:hypothetical protein BYT27DRAFT_7210595 [Phlegmacium glaucopus]
MAVVVSHVVVLASHCSTLLVRLRVQTAPSYGIDTSSKPYSEIKQKQKAPSKGGRAVVAGVGIVCVDRDESFERCRAGIVVDVVIRCHLSSPSFHSSRPSSFSCPFGVVVTTFRAGLLNLERNKDW